MAWPDDPLDDDIDTLFAGRLLVPLNDAWKALGIKKSYGHELINRGILERVHVGGASRVTVRSIKKALKDGVPLPPR